MSFVKKLADLFRSSESVEKKPIDKFGILSPLMNTIEYTETTARFLTLFMNQNKVGPILTARNVQANSYQEKGRTAYQLYLKALSAHDQAMERQVPLSTMKASLEAILGNLEIIEDNFAGLFGDMVKDTMSIKSSSVVMIGYIETVNAFCHWVSLLASHLMPAADESFTPFATKELITKAPMAGEFATNNLGKWTPRYKGLLGLVKDMQRKGTDVVMKTGDTWIDTLVHDNQFSHTEQELITAAFRNPILMLASRSIAREQAEIANLTARREWLISKIALEESKAHQLDPNSPEYKKLKKAVDFYASRVSEYEQKLERMRA